MGFLKGLFGYGEASPKNKSEKEASRDYIKEYRETKSDPIPTKTPDWAKGGVPDAGQKK